MSAGFRLSPLVRVSRYELRFDLDLDAWRFTGHERCHLVLERPQREVVLHAAELDLRDIRIRTTGGVLEPRVTADPDAETVTLACGAEVGPGPCVVELDLAGAIRDDLKALYRSTRGHERYAVTTLWPAESRRLYACLDEPPFKAGFALELVVASGLTAIANSRVVERRDLGDGRALWRFAETPPLSPYLLAFAVGPFDGTDVVSTRAGHPVRVWVPRGLAGDAVYARDAQRDCIDLLEEYTAIPYPYDKVEGVGVADFPAGAMENPGAVTYRLEIVTTDPAKASARALKGTVRTVAHELTHMWWGDLATLAWWDDLWLSESFATFVGRQTEDALHPEWSVWRDFVMGMTHGFSFDALASTHAIHAPAESAAAALQRVDPVTYQKGAAVLRMLETYLGEEPFREGVRLYLRRHGGGAATASDFWRALDDASGQDVTRIARTWITEPGHPLVELAVRDGRLRLRQRRFFADPAAPASPQRWPVPVVLRTPHGETRLLLDREETEIALPPGEWLFPNAHAAGFYRFAMDAVLRSRILLHLRELSAEERLLLLDNEWALLLAGAIRATDHVALLRALAGERDRAVLQVALDQLRWLGPHAPEGTSGAFALLVEALFAPVLEELGMDARPRDDDDVRELRETAIRALGEVSRSPRVRAEAAARIGRHLDGDRQDPDLVSGLAAVAAMDGDARLHEAFLARVRGDDPQETHRFRRALPLFPDDASTRRTLEACDDGTIRDQDLRDVFAIGFRNGAQRRAYWRGFTERYERRFAQLEGIVRTGLLFSLAQLTAPDLAAEADAFLERAAAPQTAEIVARTREALRLGSAAAQRIGAELPEALG